MEKGWLHYKLYKEDVEYISYLILSHYKGESFDVEYTKYNDKYCFLLYINKRFFKSFDMNDIVFKSVVKIERAYRKHLIIKYLYLNKDYKEELIKIIEDKMIVYTLSGYDLKIKRVSSGNYIVDNKIFISSEQDYISLMDFKNALMIIRQAEVESGFKQRKRRKK